MKQFFKMIGDIVSRKPIDDVKSEYISKRENIKVLRKCLVEHHNAMLQNLENLENNLRIGCDIMTQDAANRSKLEAIAKSIADQSMNVNSDINKLSEITHAVTMLNKNL